MIRNALTSKVGRQILTARKHSPAILFVAGTVGIVATVVVASRATLKSDEVLSVAEKDLSLSGAVSTYARAYDQMRSPAHTYR